MFDLLNDRTEELMERLKCQNSKTGCNGFINPLKDNEKYCRDCQSLESEKPLGEK